MPRQIFTGKLTKTTVRPDGPAGQPLTQALFHSTDTDSIVAVWHDTPPPVNLTIGQKYEVAGQLVRHNGKTFLFKPEVQRVLRHLLLRPLDWSRISQVISVSGAVALAVLAVAGMNYAASRDQQQRGGKTVASAYSSDDSSSLSLNGGNPANVSSSGTAATPASSSAAASTSAASSPPVSNAADCATQAVPFTTLPARTDDTVDANVQSVIVPGTNGLKKICYPNGRSKPAVVTIVKQPVSRVISIGSKPAPDPVVTDTGGGTGTTGDPTDTTGSGDPGGNTDPPTDSTGDGTPTDNNKTEQ